MQIQVGQIRNQKTKSRLFAFMPSKNVSAKEKLSFLLTRAMSAFAVAVTTGCYGGISFSRLSFPPRKVNQTVSPCNTLTESLTTWESGDLERVDLSGQWGAM